MNQSQSHGPQKQRSGFLRECKQLIQGLKNGAGVELTGNKEQDRKTVEDLLTEKLSNRPELEGQLAKDLKILLILDAQFSDLSQIENFDMPLISKLRDLGTRAVFRNTDSTVIGSPLSLSLTEFTEFSAQQSGIYPDFVCGPTILKSYLTEVVSLLRQIGHDVVGVYEDSEIASIYYPLKSQS
jgi:hypothetical protein